MKICIFFHLKRRKFWHLTVWRYEGGGSNGDDSSCDNKSKDDNELSKAKDGYVLTQNSSQHSCRQSTTMLQTCLSLIRPFTNQLVAFRFVSHQISRGLACLESGSSLTRPIAYKLVANRFVAYMPVVNRFVAHRFFANKSVSNQTVAYQACHLYQSVWLWVISFFNSACRKSVLTLIGLSPICWSAVTYRPKCNLCKPSTLITCYREVSKLPGYKNPYKTNRIQNIGPLI